MMIRVVCYDLATGMAATVHEWPDTVSSNEVDQFLAYEVSQDHGTDRVYYVTNTELGD